MHLTRKCHDHGTAKKSHIAPAVTRHQGDYYSKEKRLYHLIKMIAKIYRTPLLHTKTRTQHRIPTSNQKKLLTKNQQQQNHHLRTSSSLNNFGTKCILLAPNLCLVSVLVESQIVFSSHGDRLKMSSPPSNLHIFPRWLPKLKKKITICRVNVTYA